MYIFLLLIMLTNLLVFVLAGIWASDIQANVQDAWSHINETMTAFCKDVVLEPGAQHNVTLSGDVDAGVRGAAGWISPNPGGVGPMTRAMLVANVVELAEAAERAASRRQGEQL